MPRGKLFATIAIVSTVFLTAGIATAHGRQATARVHLAAVGHSGNVHVAKVHHATRGRSPRA
jgi:hypothetical protein